MGQRANYIIKKDNQLTIHYHHWRAINIFPDLCLGENAFLEFLSRCEINDELMTTVWIEACVIVDLDTKNLYFYTEHVYDNESYRTSVMEYYLSKLQNKWPGWQTQYLVNKMYDVEKILNIDYISQQPPPEFTPHSADFITEDTCDEWTSALVILQLENKLFITKTGNITSEAILIFGETIIPLLLSKPQFELPKERQCEYPFIFIDTITRKIILSESSFGLWEYSAVKWPGYQLVICQYGYLDALQHLHIDTEGLKMSPQEIENAFEPLAAPARGYDPTRIAEILMKEDKNIEFNPEFFNNPEPKSSDTHNATPSPFTPSRKAFGLIFRRFLKNFVK